MKRVVLLLVGFILAGAAAPGAAAGRPTGFGSGAPSGGVTSLFMVPTVNHADMQSLSQRRNRVRRT